MREQLRMPTHAQFQSVNTPFPITVDANSTFGIKLDFNVNSSVQSDLSITPVVRVAQVIHRQHDDEHSEMEQADDVDGQVRRWAPISSR
jgi:hypothetical protein